ncbi:MAG: LPS assembly lipoprotein LptE [Desulfovibrio sp.]
MSGNRFLSFCAVLLAAVFVSGCGYQLAGSGPVNLPEDQRTLCMDSVENPTLETWLGPRLRSELRDELHRRGWTHWVERSQADLLVRVVIDRYSRSTKVSDENDETLRSQANLSMRVDFVSRVSDKVVWSSGKVSANESYFGGSPTEADMSVTELAVRRAVDKLSESY